MTLTLEDFLTQLAQLGLASRDEMQAVLEQALSTDANSVVRSAAAALVRAGKVTEFQAQSLLEGKPVAIGPYLFEDKLADGGMGQVYLARHRTMNRRVAVKTIHEKQIGSPRAAARFQREIQALAALQHPHIVTAFDAGEAEGVAYLAMEYIEGRNLAQEVKLRGRLPVNAALEYIRQAATGLQYIHQEGIIHRDIKPSNLFLERTGTIKILDLGLSRWADWRDRPDPESTADVTVDGEIVGTFDFMAPEQFANLRDVDQRSDIFSLGCTLYFLLHGKPPFSGRSMGEKLLARHDQSLPALGEGRPDVGPELERIFQQMVVRDPQARFVHVEQLLQALRALQEQSFDIAPPVAQPRSTPPARPTGRRSGAAWVIGATLCALLAGGAVWFSRDRNVASQQPPAPQEPPPTHEPLPPQEPSPTQEPLPPPEPPLASAEPEATPSDDEPPLSPARAPDVDEVEVDPAPSVTPTPAPSAPPESTAAEWVFAHGGTVDVSGGSGFLPGLSSSEALPAPPFSIVRMTLAGCTIAAGELQAIADLPDLIWLDLSRSTVQNDDLASVSRLPRLETLSLNSCQIGDEGLRRLTRLPALHSLDVRGTLVTDEGLGLLTDLPALTTLLLGEGQTVTVEGLRRVRNLRTLTNLGLRGSAVGDEGLGLLAELKSLVWLDVGNTLIGDSGLTAIQELPLRTLYLDGTQATDQGAALFTEKNCEVIR